MILRNLAARALPPAFHKLQSAGIISDPFREEGVRKLGLKHPNDKYREFRIGTYEASKGGPTPSYCAHDPLSKSYGETMAEWCRSFEAPWNFGYYEASNVKVWPRFGVFSAESGHFLDVYCSPRALRNPKYEIPRRALSLLPHRKQFEHAVFISVAWYHNYYHWLVDILPRLSFVKKELAEGWPVICPKGIRPQFRAALRASLDALGMNSTELLELPDGIYSFRRLIMPTNPSMSLDVSPHQRNFIRSSLRAPAADIKKRKRLYVSRRDASVRRILNEQEVTSLLGRFGFETVTLSSLDISEQARLFAEAEMVVSHHGAALTNLAFCEPGTFVIEIFQEGHFAPCFARLAQVGGLRYGFAVGLEQNGDTVVAVDHLHQLLRETIL